MKISITLIEAGAPPATVDAYPPGLGRGAVRAAVLPVILPLLGHDDAMASDVAKLCWLVAVWGEASGHDHPLADAALLRWAGGLLLVQVDPDADDGSTLSEMGRHLLAAASRGGA